MIAEQKTSIIPTSGEPLAIFSEKDVDSFTNIVISKARLGKYIRQPLKDFFHALSENPGPGAVAVARRKDFHGIRGGLDFYILWHSPINDDSRVDYQQMDLVDNAHFNFSQQVELQRRDSLHHIVDGSFYNSAKDFAQALKASLANDQIPADLIACVVMPRIHGTSENELQ